MVSEHADEEAYSFLLDSFRDAVAKRAELLLTGTNINPGTRHDITRSYFNSPRSWKRTDILQPS